MYIGIMKLFLLMTRLLNMQQTNFMYSQSVIKVIKGTAVQFTGQEKTIELRNLSHNSGFN